MRATFLVKVGRGLFKECSCGFFLEKFLLSRLWAKVTQIFSVLRGRREFI